MHRRLITDRDGQFRAEIQVRGPVLSAALTHLDADDVLKASLISALLALVQDGPWPPAFVQTVREFMRDIRDEVVATDFH